MIFCYITIYIKWQGVASRVFYGVLHFPSISTLFPAFSLPCPGVPLSGPSSLPTGRIRPQETARFLIKSLFTRPYECFSKDAQYEQISTHISQNSDQ